MLSDQSPILVTGGAGFIGSHFVLDWFSTVGTPLVNLDKLTYAGNLRNLLPIADRTGYHFVRGDIQDRVYGSGAICWPPYPARRLASGGRGDGRVPRFG